MKAEGILPTVGSKFDELTGLYNREAFFREASLLLGVRYDVNYCIVCMDISCFKIINDLFHMETGNLILCTAADYLKSILNPKTALGCRTTADHFILCIPSEELHIEEIIKNLDSKIQGLHISHNILFFAGIYPVEKRDLPIEQMCDRASMALKRIKGSYLTRYAYYDAKMRDEMIEELLITGNLEVALNERQFTIFLQPIFDPKKNKIVSAEALVRWFHPIHGMVSPGKFIPVCERNGFIVRLDRFVWEEACRFQRNLLDKGKPIVPISVNLSRLNFYSLDLPEFLSLLLAKYELEPWMLKLEITESAYTDNQTQLWDMIHTFKSMGFAVLMDDFGSGYSSLNMLKDMPLDTIKIDMAFIRELEKSERVAIILKFVVEMVEALNMGVVVEGVETKKQCDYVSSLGEVAIQGYYFSRPLPMPEYEKLLDKYPMDEE
ncbi:MAG: bifunctional diguanylate cyclase/phosphodiesterase [Selenomonadaceae bacterium]|nr:bifunctional diguanylate cyclase/phosphodiesterase [Selenomonadaceae bacterium]